MSGSCAAVCESGPGEPGPAVVRPAAPAPDAGARGEWIGGGPLRPAPAVPRGLLGGALADRRGMQPLVGRASQDGAVGVPPPARQPAKACRPVDGRQRGRHLALGVQATLDSGEVVRRALVQVVFRRDRRPGTQPDRSRRTSPPRAAAAGAGRPRRRTHVAADGPGEVRARQAGRAAGPGRACRRRRQPGEGMAWCPLGTPVAVFESGRRARGGLGGAAHPGKGPAGAGARAPAVGAAHDSPGIPPEDTAFSTDSGLRPSGPAPPCTAPGRPSPGPTGTSKSMFSFAKTLAPDRPFS